MAAASSVQWHRALLVSFFTFGVASTSFSLQSAASTRPVVHEPTIPPDTSLSTLPVAYYGAQWTRDDANIDLLSKMQIVILMQEEGPCWKICCPYAGTASWPNHRCNGSINASAMPGCDPSCDQQGYQAAVFERIKTAAKANARRPPHCMLFHNTVYDWPFDHVHSGGHAIDVLDVHGRPHMESCDPGIFPSFFFDHGSPAGRAAYLSVIERLVVNGSADGVYSDCYMESGLSCDPDTGKCIANRNGKIQSLNDEVTAAQVDAYNRGKNETLWAASKLVGPNGTLLAKYAKPSTLPPHGGNLIFCCASPAKNGTDIIESQITEIKEGLQNYQYIIVGKSNDYVAPTDSNTDARCSESDVAKFLLSVEPGCFLLCNGYAPWQEYKLGVPVGPAMRDNTGKWSRRFVSGTVATWSGSTGSVSWGGIKA